MVVYDTDGYYVGPGVAELLAAEGYEVTVVTTFPVLSPVSDETLEGEMLRAHLHRAGIQAVHATTITEIKPGVTAAGRGGGGPRPPRRSLVGRRATGWCWSPSRPPTTRCTGS